MSREDERCDVGDLGANDTHADDSEEAIKTLANRVTRLEAKIAELVDQVDENRVDHEKKLARTNKRVTTLEEKSSEGALALECKLTEMERHLAGVDELSPRATASTKRAIALAQIWDKIARTVGGGPRQVANIKRDNIIAWMEEAMANEEGADVSYSPKQVHRAMETFANLFEGKAEHRKGKNGTRELVIDDPDAIIWSSEDLDAELRQQSM
ncbi:hypothetical protein [Natronorubrum sp. DTA7]|uniref:hypothetical protein n=1 Tax=Natronorubrum sp. DTA7 TaxID=3447016 RepID=UPI003F873083